MRISDWSSDVFTDDLGQVACERQQLLVGELLQVDAQAVQLAVVVVDLVEELAQRGHLGLRLQHVVDLPAHALGGPAQVYLEDLADVHKSEEHTSELQSLMRI